MPEAKTWLALRTPAGELEPLDELDTGDLRRLTIQAGLLGLSLQEWMKAILRASLTRNEQVHGWIPLSAEEKMGNRWVELQLEPDLLNALKQGFYGDNCAVTLGDFVGAFLCFVANPGSVFLARRLARGGAQPEEIAGRLLLESEQRMGLPCKEMDRMEKQEGHDFEQMQWAVPIGRDPITAELVRQDTSHAIGAGAG